MWALMTVFFFFFSANVCGPVASEHHETPFHVLACDPGIGETLTLCVIQDLQSHLTPLIRLKRCSFTISVDRVMDGVRNDWTKSTPTSGLSSVSTHFFWTQ